MTKLTLSPGRASPEALVDGDQDSAAPGQSFCPSRASPEALSRQHQDSAAHDFTAPINQLPQIYDQPTPIQVRQNREALTTLHGLQEAITSLVHTTTALQSILTGSIPTNRNDPPSTNQNVPRTFEGSRRQDTPKYQVCILINFMVGLLSMNPIEY